MQFKRILNISQQMIRDKKYRNHIINRLTKETKRAAKPITSSASISKEDRNFLKGLKVGFVGGCEISFTKEFLESSGAICYHTFDHNESSDPYLALSDKNGGIFKFKPEFVIISDAQNVRSYISEIQHGKATFEKQNNQLDETRSKVFMGLKEARKELSSSYILMNYPLSIRPAHGNFAYKSLSNSLGVREFLKSLDLSYYSLSKEEDDLFILSTDETFLKNSVGYQIRESDANGIYEHLTRDGGVIIGRELINYFKIIKNAGKRIKCIVVDLDNTLWDGIIRDDGIDGIHLYYNRLEVLELLSKRGILLAIASKNDKSIEPLINKVLGKYANIFSSKKISWNDKAQSLQEIAQELNIGIDSLAFFDDNPYERDQIRVFLPDVLVLPETEILYSLNKLEFEPVGKLTEESAKRTKMYSQQKKREVDENKFIDKESFLRSCSLSIWMREAKKENLGRVTELIQRTNQLNATTLRYSKEQIQEFFKSNDYKIFVIDLFDRYGEYGLIGVTLIHFIDDKWVMEVLTFSCRAMGKTVEKTFLLYLMNEAKKLNVKKIIGKYRKTERNEAIERIFKESNFEKESTENNFVLWEYNFEKKGIKAYPDWFKIISK